MRLRLFAPLLLACCARPAPPPADAAPAEASAPVPAPAASVVAAPAAPHLAAVDVAVDASLARGDAPGAVVLVRVDGHTIHERAYGKISEYPWPAPMAVDAIFDLASLTKPLATALSVMVLLEDARLSLGDRVADHVPEARGTDVGRATLEQLLLHTSGLPADDELKADDGRDPTAAVLRVKTQGKPGERFVYSDLGYVLLAQIAERVAGRPLPNLLRRVTSPMGLRELAFSPDTELRARIAPTTRRDGVWLRGVVHDPRAAKMGGVAGHAGLFGSASDVARVVEMLLAGGVHDGLRILKAETVAEMLRPRRAPPFGKRALGWDVDTGYTHQRGKRFTHGFGHTGFTGTSVWADTETKTVIVVLTSRLHPDGKGDVKRLRSEVADAVASVVLAPTVRAGIDVLARDGFAPILGKKVGLLTHDAARDLAGTTTREVLADAKGVQLIKLFAPEHGFSGKGEGKQADAIDPLTKLPVVSLYGEKRAPTDRDLAGLDALVVDLVDVGARSFTYASTLGHALVAAERAKLPVVVLDRPNPLGGAVVEGPMLDAGKQSFVAFARVLPRHGLTMGEVAGWLTRERGLSTAPEVVKVEGWRREDGYWKTRLPWHRPSPNLVTPVSALLYPGVALLETTNVSVGRGTDTPFQLVGAPWIDGQRLARMLEAQHHPGLRFEATLFTPRAAIYVGQVIGGVRIFVDDPSVVRPVRLGLALARSLSEIAPATFELKGIGTLLGNEAVRALLERRAPWKEIDDALDADERAFEQARAASLLY